MLDNKTLLVTVGTCSFGNAVLGVLLIQRFLKLEFLAEMKKNKMICVKNLMIKN